MSEVLTLNDTRIIQTLCNALEFTTKKKAVREIWNCDRYSLKVMADKNEYAREVHRNFTTTAEYYINLCERFKQRPEDYYLNNQDKWCDLQKCMLDILNAYRANKNPFEAFCCVGRNTIEDIACTITEDMIDEDVRPNYERWIAEAEIFEYVDENCNALGSTYFRLRPYDLKELSEGAREILKEQLYETDYFISKNKGDYIAICHKGVLDDENYIARMIAEKLRQTHKPLSITLAEDTKLSEEQMNALETIRSNPITLLTGEGGTGKTKVIKEFVESLEEKDIDYVLCASTGIASKRLSESTGKDVCTMASLIFEEEPIGRKVVICDEMSMIGTQTFAEFLKLFGDYWMDERTRLVLIGDDKQLLSVDIGNIMHDMLECEEIPTARLTKVYRCNDEGIYDRATEVRNGDISNYTESKDGYHYQQFTKTEEVVDLYKRLGRDTMVLCLSNWQCDNINNELRVNDLTKKFFTFHMGMNVKEGDLILCKTNHVKSGKQVYNGYRGKVIEADQEHCVVIWEGDESCRVRYAKSEKDKQVRNAMISMRYGYAMTVHSSQGNEADNVIFVADNSDTTVRMATANLFYVAITRAKKNFYLLEQTGQKALKIGIANKQRSDIKRITTLQGKLRKNFFEKKIQLTLDKIKKV